MKITFSQYTKPKYDDGIIVEGAENNGINAVIDGITMAVPLDPANRHYSEILRQVEAGTLVIQEADNDNNG